MHCVFHPYRIVESSLTQSRRHRRSRFGDVRGFDADKCAAPRGPIATLGHLKRDVRTEAVELLEHQVESRIAHRLQQVLALYPKRLFVVPGCPTAVCAIEKCPFG